LTDNQPDNQPGRQMDWPEYWPESAGEYEYLVDCLLTPLVRFAYRRLQSLPDAEDVVQDAAVVAFRKRSQFQAGTSFQAWVGAIVRNVALNVKRSQKRRRGAVNGLAGTLAPAAITDLSTVEDAMLGKDQGIDARVLAALGEIGDIARACLLLRTVGDLQYADIASVLDIPEGTAMSHVHRSRATLRERLGPVWREHHGANQTETEPGSTG